MSVVLDEPKQETFNADEFVDLEALIREARARQRRRWLGVLAATFVLTGGGVAVWRVAFTGDGRPSSAGQSKAVVVLPPTLTLHLIGWGTVIQGYSGLRGGHCADGVTRIPIVASSGQHVGSLSECDLVVSKAERSNGALLRTQANILGSYELPDGTIKTRERRTYTFALDQIHTYAHFTGLIVGGSGRYAHALGTISGGGPGNTGGLGESDTTHWTVIFHFHFS